MNGKLYLLPLFIWLASAFVSCEETEEVGRYDNWRARNEAFIDSLENVFETGADPELKRFNLYVNPSDYIYYKEKTPVESDEQNTDPAVYGKRPVTGSTVKVYYKGMNILRERFDGFYGEDPNVDKPGDSDVNVDEGETNASEFTVSSSVITGWQETLQHMKVGERWEVYIPYNYGYGSRDQTDSSTGTTTIRGYSTLIFDMQLLDADPVAEEDE